MLIILKFIEKLSGSINAWSKKKIETYRPIKKYKMDFLKTMFFGLIFIISVISFSFLICFKDIKPGNQKVEKTIESPFDTLRKNEYKRLKTRFTWLEKDVYDFIKIEAEKKEVDPHLIMSVIQIESGDFCKNNWAAMKKVKGTSGEIGPMQVMPYHARNPKNLYDWKYNIKKGIGYFKGGLEIGQGDIRVAIRLYNQGHAGKWQNYKNWKYVARVMRKYKKVLTDRVMVAKI